MHFERCSRWRVTLLGCLWDTESADRATNWATLFYDRRFRSVSSGVVFGMATASETSREGVDRQVVVWGDVCRVCDTHAFSRAADRF